MKTNGEMMCAHDGIACFFLYDGLEIKNEEVAAGALLVEFCMMYKCTCLSCIVNKKIEQKIESTEWQTPSDGKSLHDPSAKKKKTTHYFHKKFNGFGKKRVFEISDHIYLDQ